MDRRGHGTGRRPCPPSGASDSGLSLNVGRILEAIKRLPEAE